ncbi:MAG: serine hydrolase domain-containing protein [bacterium]|nr:serine hydrolase domain-containing protein [bacterium]
MNRRTFLKLAALGAGAAFLPVTMGGEKASLAQASPESLDGLLEPIRAAHGMPALAGAFVRGSDLAAIGATGVRRAGTADRVQVHDRFHIGSCTKSMTATLIALLVEQSKLSWGATVADVFPDLLGKIHSGYHRVTAVHLLSHRAGLPERSGADPSWPQVRALAGPLQQQRRALIEIVLSRAPVAEPGSRMAYSNFGYTIAGAFAEQVTGQRWEDLMHRMLFSPLGMTIVGFGAPGLAQPWGHKPTGCHPVAPGPDADNPPVIGPAGTVHCSMGGWARYAALHLRGALGEPGLLVGTDSFERLHRDEFGQGYALGWSVVRRGWAGGTALTHAGTNGFWYAFVWLAPARNAAFLAATNCGPEVGLRACDAAVAAMIRKYLS